MWPPLRPQRRDRTSVSIQLFAHPFSSYCWKVLIALYENDTPFAYRILDEEHPENSAELAQRWPMMKFPAIVDGDRFIVESSIIIEHLSVHYPGPVSLIPQDDDGAIEARMLDRFFDNYIMNNMQVAVGNALRPKGKDDPYGQAQAKTQIDTAYQILDRWMAERTWAAADSFTLADCAAAPALFYADWAYPIPTELAHAHAYRARLLARPSVKRVVDEARPYRHYFPLGAPDRD